MRVVSALIVAVAVMQPTQAFTPSVHGMPVDLSPLYGQSVVGYVCETQPREYADTRGRIHVEADRYVQLDECPKEKIR